MDVSLFGDQAQQTARADFQYSNLRLCGANSDANGFLLMDLVLCHDLVRTAYVFAPMEGDHAKWRSVSNSPCSGAS